MFAQLDGTQYIKSPNADHREDESAMRVAIIFSWWLNVCRTVVLISPILVLFGMLRVCLHWWMEILQGIRGWIRRAIASAWLHNVRRSGVWHIEFPPPYWIELGSDLELVIARARTSFGRVDSSSAGLTH
jgi:hypothetical protein